jgi:hypothetical protein
MSETKRMDPSTRFVRSLDGEYFMLREAAEILGISSQALRKTVHDKTINAPSFWVMFGKLKIYLYTRDDVEEIRAWLKAREEVYKTGETPEPRVGRPRKYTPEQKAEKQREYARSYYWRNQLAKGEKNNDEALIQKAKAKLFELTEEPAVEEAPEPSVVVQPEFIHTETQVNDTDPALDTTRQVVYQPFGS